MYALANTVSTPDSATTYVHVVSSLDIKDKLGNQDAREYRKYATIAALDGELLIASDEAPEVQRFSVGSDLKLKEGDKGRHDRLPLERQVRRQELRGTHRRGQD